MPQLPELVRRNFALPDPAREALAGYFVARELARGEALVRVGQTATLLALASRGVIVEYSTASAGATGAGSGPGRELLHRAYVGGELLGDVASVVEHRPAERGLRVASETALVYVLDARGLAAARRLPGWAALESRLLAHCHRRLASHTARWRRLSAAERYAYVQREQPSLLTGIPLKTLAAYLDVTPATLSRLRARLAEAG